MHMRKWFLVTIATAVMGTVLHAGTKNRSTNGLSKTAVTFAQRIKQGFNMRVWLSNQMTMGGQAWDTDPNRTPDGYGLEYPAGSGIEHVYGGGPWFGGIVNGVRHVSEGYNGDDARKEFIPEYSHLPREHFWRTAAGSREFDSLGYSGYYYNHGIVVNKRGCDNDGDGRVNEDDLDGFDNDGDWNPATDDVGADGLPDSIEVSCDGQKYDPVLNPDPAQDDYDPSSRDKCHPNPDGSLPRKNNKDIYTERNGIPDHGEPHVDEDYGAISDNDLYCSATDTFKYPSVASHFPMGIKVIQKSYAWAGAFADGILPFDYYFVNVGHNVINSVYVGFFIDADDGPRSVPNYYTHDFACYFDSLRTAYIHNPQDRGSTPIGITVLKTPRALDSLKYIFQWWDFTTRSGPGTVDSVIYSWMSGDAFPNQLIWPCQPPTALSDTRFMFSFGPFDVFKPGDTLRISVALVSGFSVDQGPNNLKANAQNALKLFNRGYVAPIVPPSPSLKITQGFKKVTLQWGGSVGPINPLEIWDDSNKIANSYPDTSWRRINPPCGAGCGGHLCVNGKLPGGRIFEGYNLYRSEDPSDPPLLSSFTLIRQYDLPGDPYGYNVGLDSIFIDTNLVRGKTYWYAVTSFGIPDMALIPVKQPDGSVRYDTLLTANTESSIMENATKVTLAFSPSDRAGQVLVVPNPYRVDKDYTYENGGWEGRARDWSENNRLVKFIHLPPKCTIRIFTLAGDQVTTLYHDDPVVGELEWNLLSESNRALASGVYVYSVESDFGTQIGKFVLIR